ncbi:hypothetical protein Tco_0280293 [Tanacetum coccineum]
MKMTIVPFDLGILLAGLLDGRNYPHTFWYRICNNGQNKDKSGQNQAREWNEREKTSPTSSLIPLSRGSFDVIVGMNWLSKRKFVIVCHEKVVRIPLEGDEILRVHGERTQGKNLMNTKVDEPKLSDISVVDVGRSEESEKKVFRDADCANLSNA